MIVEISNNYGGDICTMKFNSQIEGCFGFAVKITGFIETKTFKIQHATSTGKFVQNSLVFKIPENIIPTFGSKNFKVEYQVDCTLIFQDRKESVPFSLVIHNNNLIDFNYADPINICLDIIPDNEFNINKELACKSLLANMKMDPMICFKKPSSDIKSMVSFIDSKSELDIPSLTSSPGNLTGFELKTATKTNEEEVRNRNILQIPGKSYRNSEALDNELHYNEVRDNELHYNEARDNFTVKYKQRKEMQNKEENGEFKSPKLEAIKRPESKSLPEEIQDDIDTIISKVLNISEQLKYKAVTEAEKKKSIVYELKKDLGCILSKIVEKKNILDEEMQKELLKIQNETAEPDFPMPTIVKLINSEKVFSIVDDGEELATLHYPAFITEKSSMRIVYLKSIKNTQVNVWREDACKGSVVDIENVFSMAFDSENCLEKTVYFDIKDFTLKTFAFEVSFTMKISLDYLEAEIPFQVVSKALNPISSL
ncbi:hypothetical protein GINT2_001486 [Glugoides intestinalis]